MTRYRAILAYDGTNYAGFQRQASGTPTVQFAVEQAIFSLTNQQAHVVGAGRTDTGVHAVGQTIAFDVEWSHTPTALLQAINAHLPDDVALQSLVEHEGFHPRFHALWRQYRYTILYAECRQPLLEHSTWHRYGALDLQAMQSAASALIGTHDFGAFGQPPQGTNTVREVYRSEWETVPADYGMLYIYRVRATAFLYHMVRHIVATLVDVGRGTLSVDEFREIIASAGSTRVKPLAPAKGLVFEAVGYPHDNTSGQRSTEIAGLNYQQVDPLEE